MLSTHPSGAARLHRQPARLWNTEVEKNTLKVPEGSQCQGLSTEEKTAGTAPIPFPCALRLLPVPAGPGTPAAPRMGSRPGARPKETRCLMFVL